MKSIEITKQALQSLLAIASKDTCRERICSIAVDFDRGAFAATDGHRAAVLHFCAPDTVTADESWVVFKRAVVESACKVAGKATDVVRFHCDEQDSGKLCITAVQCSATFPAGHASDVQFPPLAQVIPEHRNGTDGHCCPHLQPDYLADMSKLGKAILAYAKIGGYFGNTQHASARVQTGDWELAPVRFDVGHTGTLVWAVYVVMPVRA